MPADRKVALLVAEGADGAHLAAIGNEARRHRLLVSLVQLETPGAPLPDRHPARDLTIRVPLHEAAAENYSSLIVPGGIQHCDTLRANGPAVDFLAAFVDAGKPVAVIGHAAWLLIESGHAPSLLLAAPRSIRTDLDHAGATWTSDSRASCGTILSCADGNGIVATLRELFSVIETAEHV